VTMILIGVITARRELVDECGTLTAGEASLRREPEKHYTHNTFSIAIAFRDR
jgi:hypothetical protein